MVKININFSNKTFFIILAVFAILAVSGIAIASLGATPNPGHQLSELQKCSEGEILKMVGGNWACATESSGGVSSPACTLCISCGGAWTSAQGVVVDYENLDRARGEGCSGNPDQIYYSGNQLSLCCK